MTSAIEDQKCENLVDEHRDSRVNDIRRLLDARSGEGRTMYRHPDNDKDSICEECAEAADLDLDELEEVEAPTYCETCSADLADEDGNLFDLGNLNEYGLSIDYQPSDETTEGEPGYLRFQISWGGPSEEFRYFIDADHDCYKIEFWYLDWFDGASRTLYGTDRETMMELYQDWKDCESIAHWIEQAKD